MKLLVITVNFFAICLIAKGQSTENSTDDYEETSSAFDDYGSSTEHRETTQPSLISENPSTPTKYCTKTELVIANVTEFNYTWSFTNVLNYYAKLSEEEIYETTLFLNNTNLKLSENELPGNWSVFIRKEKGESGFAVIMKLEPEESTCHMDIRPYLSVTEHPAVRFNAHIPLIKRKELRHSLHHMNNYNYYYNQTQTYNMFGGDMTSPPSNYSYNNNNYSSSYNTMSHQAFGQSRPIILNSVFEWRFNIYHGNFEYNYSHEDLSIFNLNFHVLASETHFETTQLQNDDC